MRGGTAAARLPILLAGCGLGPVAKAAAADCELAHLDAQAPGAAARFAAELRGKHAALLTGLVGHEWPGLSWSVDEWRAALGSAPLPRRKLSTVSSAGAVHAAEEVPAEALFNGSAGRSEGAGGSADDAVVFSTSRSDAAVRRLRELGVLRTPALLEEVALQPVLSVGLASEGLPFHQHEEAWLALLHGEKEWFLRRPEAEPRDVRRRVPAGQLVGEEGTLRCRQLPGQVVYFPHMWWHATYNGAHASGNLTVGVGGIGKSSEVLEMLQEGDVEALERRMEEDKDLRSWLAARGPVWAAKMGHAEVLDKLVGFRADLAQRLDGTEAGQTLAHVAAASGHVSLVSRMIDLRADMRARDAGADALGAPRQGRQPLHVAVESGHLGVAKLLLERRASLGAKMATGMQPLGLACGAGHVELLGWVLERLGPKVKLRGKHAEPTVLAAVAGGHLRVLDLLERRGAAVRELNRRPEGMRPVQVATANGHAEAIGWLLGRGAELDAGDEQGVRPVHLAVQHGRGHLLPFLHEHGADIGARDGTGGQPVHWAGYMGHVSMLQWLTEQGADPAARDDAGNQPAHSAAMGGHVAVLKWLDKQGAVPDNVAETEEVGSPEAMRWLSRWRQRRAKREL